MRIRSVKPEFWDDPHSTGRWPADMSLLYIGLWNYADDWGKFEYDPELIQAKLDPFHVKWNDICKVLTRLSDAGCLVVYTVNGRLYGIIPKLRDHQHPQHPCKDSLPEPPAGLSESSVSPHIVLPPESRGEERSIRPVEGSVSQPSLPLPGMQPPPSASPAAPAEEVLLSFPCKPTKGGKDQHFNVTPDLVAKWTADFPDMDVLAVLREARVWFDANKPPLRLWSGVQLWLRNTWLKNPMNGRSSKHGRISHDPEADAAEQRAAAAWAEVRDQVRATIARGDIGRRLPSAGADEVHADGVPADGGDLPAADGEPVVHRGETG